MDGASWVSFEQNNLGGENLKLGDILEVPKKFSTPLSQNRGVTSEILFQT